MLGWSMQCFKSSQFLLCVSVSLALFLYYSPSSVQMIFVDQTIKATNEKREVNFTEEFNEQEIIDYSRCSTREPLKIFVHEFDHPLAAAMADHPAATKNEKDACLFVAFTDGVSPSVLSTWTTVSEPGINHIIINLDTSVSIVPEGREMIVQSSFENGAFRPLIDLSLSTDVEAFHLRTWEKRPSIMPLERETIISIVVDVVDLTQSAPIPQVQCEGDCSSSLLNSTYCFLQPSRFFHSRLLSALRASCIPVILSLNQPLPFQDQLDWRLASFRFPLSMAASVPEMIEELEKEDILELRRRGRVYLARIDDAKALSKSIVAALSERIQVGLPLHPMVGSKLIAPNNEFSNTSFTPGIPSKFGAQKITGSTLYSRARWGSGRDLTYTPSTLHDVPMMPGDAPFYKGTREHLNPLDLTHDGEQFTIMILTYDRDDGVKAIIEGLRGCEFLNKIILIWNNLDRRPNGTWPEIDVPVEIILSERNSLQNRFLPYDRIETEAVVSLDDDMVIYQPELTFAFRMWRENRDRIIGFPERHHKFKNGHGMYGLTGCAHSLILTGYAMIHKEFLFEYSYNQHPAIIEHIEQNRNCEDLAMNYLVSHITRKPPLKVAKKARLNQSNAAGLCNRGNHYKKRDECIAMLSAMYGYNPLLYTVEVAAPKSGCVKGL